MVSKASLWRRLVDALASRRVSRLGIRPVMTFWPMASPLTKKGVAKASGGRHTEGEGDARGKNRRSHLARVRKKPCARVGSGLGAARAGEIAGYTPRGHGARPCAGGKSREEGREEGEMGAAL